MGYSTCDWNVTNEENFCLSLVNYQGSEGQLPVTIRFENCTFSHMTIPTITVNLEFINCTFINSAVTSKWSKEVTFVKSRWINMTRMNGIAANNVQEITLDQCKFMDTAVDTINDEALNMVSLNEVTNIKMQDILVRNITNVSNGTRNLIAISKAETCLLNDIIVKNTEKVIGVYVENTTLASATQCIFDNNQIPQTDNTLNAAMVVVKSKLLVREGNFLFNVGPALVSKLSNLTLAGCNFVGNINNFDNSLEGGALVSFDSHLTIGYSTFSLNAGVKGGSISVHATIVDQGCSLKGTHLNFNNNTATMGAAIYITSSCNMHVYQSFFMFNEGYEFGGAIYVLTPVKNAPDDRQHQNAANNSHIIDGSEFDKNWAYVAGGSIFVGCINSMPVPQLPNCDNSSAHLIIIKSNFVQMNNFTFENHTENRIYGGAVASYVGTEILNSYFIENLGYLGGGVFFYGTSNSLTNVNFESNTANISGSAVYAENSELSIEKLLHK